MKIPERFEKIDELGKGGNGVVYRVKDKESGEVYALKLLSNKTDEKRKRFREEIEIAKKVAGPGVMPIYEYDLDEFWYTMPVAIGIMDYLSKSTESMDRLNVVIGCIKQISEIVNTLHDFDVSHRDLKPSNIYYYNDSCLLGDFGLAKYTTIDRTITEHDKALGAIFTIAPEMKRDPSRADGKKADIYSLAKTIWMMLTGDDKGFDGPYDSSDPQISLKRCVDIKQIEILDLEELLTRSTSSSPDSRPTIHEFNSFLKSWIQSLENLDSVQYSRWMRIDKELLTKANDFSLVWYDVKTIVKILNDISADPAMNYMIVPGGGGDDLSRVMPTKEEGCIKLRTQLELNYILKPKALFYDRFNFAPKWNFFFLELHGLSPKFAERIYDGMEELVELSTGEYVSPRRWDAEFYDGDNSSSPFYDGAEFVKRILKGSIIVAPKMGSLNDFLTSARIEHSRYAHDNFRIELERALKKRYNQGGVA